MFAPRDDDDTVVVRRARVLAILALVSSSRYNKYKKFVNRDFVAAINSIRYVVLTRTTFVK